MYGKNRILISEVQYSLELLVVDEGGLLLENLVAGL